MVLIINISLLPKGSTVAVQQENRGLWAWNSNWAQKTTGETTKEVWQRLDGQSPGQKDNVKAIL